MKKHFTVLLGLSLIWLVTACGFQLRGQYDLPAGLQRVYIQGEANHLMQRSLRQALQSAGSEVVGVPDKATAILTLHREIYRRSPLSVAANARVREYGIEYELEYSVRLADGDWLQKRTRLYYQRDFSFDENLILAKEREESQLRRDMQQQAVHAILRRLAYLQEPSS